VEDEDEGGRPAGETPHTKADEKDEKENREEERRQRLSSCRARLPGRRSERRPRMAATVRVPCLLIFTAVLAFCAVATVRQPPAPLCHMRL